MMTRNRRLRLETLEDRRLLNVSPLGEAFSVNSYTSGSQQTFRQTRSAAVGMDADGDFVTVWGSRDQDGGDWGVFAQRFDSQGVAQGSEFQVNTATAQSQTFPSVAMDADGDFVVTWSSLHQDHSLYGVYAQRFDAAGAPQGDEFRVNTFTTGNQNFSAVAMDSDGDFVITWTGSDQDGDRTGVFAQRYDAAGTSQGDEFQVNTFTAGNQRYSTVGMDSAGNFVVVWSDDQQDGSSGGIIGRRFAADGTPFGDEFLVNTVTAGNQQFPSIDVASAGDFVVAWQGFDIQNATWNVYAQSYDSLAAPLGSELLVGEGKYPSVTIGASSDFVVTRETYGSTGTNPVQILAQHYDPSGTALGDGLLLDNGSGDQIGPTAAGNGDLLAIVWTSETEVATEEEVSAQLLDVTLSSDFNRAPEVSAIEDATVDEGQTVSFTASASDPDDPLETITFGLNPGAPVGATIDPASGFFTWTPLETEGPGDYLITVRASDAGTPPLTGTASFQVTVNEVNRPPVIDPVLDQSVEELQSIEFTVTATDPDDPYNWLYFSLGPNAPEGAELNEVTGEFSWTPTEEQGPGEYTFTVTVRDDGTPVRTDSTSVSISVTEGNLSPVLDPVSSQIVDLGHTLSLLVTATDPDHPPDSLSFSLDAGAPENAWIDASSGQFTWTPALDIDPRSYNVTVRVTDDGTPVRYDTETFSIEVETDMMDPLASRTIDEGELLAFLLTAAYPADPSAELVFSLDSGAPAGASIDSETGQFTWTPGENQGPGEYEITARVSVVGSSGVTDSEILTVTVNEVNQAPVLEAIDDVSANEGEMVSFTVVASDDDVPANQLTFSLDAGAPQGATIDPETGEFSWTPDETQGPLVHNITVRVTDDQDPAMDAAVTFAVTVAEVNSAPVIEEIGYQAFSLGETYSFLVPATDPDVPADVLAFSLDPSSPNGATIDSASGLISWTPSVDQGVGVYRFTVSVTDDGDPVLTAATSFDVALETAMLDAIGDRTVDEGSTLSLTATATHPDNPQAQLTFSLHETSPAGATIDTASGLLTWTPTEEQGPGTYTVIVRVSDAAVPALRDSTAFSVTVAEVNQAPAIDSVEDQSVDEGDALTLTVTASDPDVPANGLSFSLDAGSPLGAEIDPETGEFSWTPAEDQGPATHTVYVRVTDDGAPALDAVTTFSVTVGEVNSAPVLDTVPDQTVDVDETLTLTVSATDSDLPADTLLFSLEPGAPQGMAIDGTSGVLTWTPTQQQGPGIYDASVRVTDDGSGEMSDVASFLVIVEPPMLDAIADRSVDELVELSFTAAATSPYDPAEGLSFALDPGAPAGATIDRTTGQFTWTPTEAQGPGEFAISVRLTDDGNTLVSDSESFVVTVNEVNTAPVIDAIDDRIVDQGDTFSIAVTTVDPDLPGNLLNYALESGAPVGAAIDPESGVLTWTTTISDTPGTYPVAVRVTDDGNPALEDTETFSITLIEVNLPPVIEELDDFSVDEGDSVLLTVVIADPNQSTESLAMGLAEGAAGGATFDPATMEFAWATDEADGPGDYSFTIWATDNGNPVLSDAMTFVVTVTEVNEPPVIQAIVDLAGDRGTLLSYQVEVDDPDDPANGLVFSLGVGAPSGAEIDPATGLLTWTLDETVAFGSYGFSVSVADDGSPSLEDTETFSVTVEPPMLDAIADQTVDEWSELNLTAIATAPYDPADGLSFSLDAYSLQLGAQIDPATGLLTWTPTEDQGPGSYRITVQLTDDGDPSVSDSESFWVTVNEVSDELILQPIADVTLYAGAPLHVSLNATGSHASSLGYSVSTDNTDLAAAISDTNRSLQISVQNTGKMTFELFEDQTPRTTARIVELAQDGFYDGLIFHRVASSADGSPFVIQAGDPGGNGNGGSGVMFDDEFHPELQHTSAGVLSMAHRGYDTNDSQFFITGNETRYLDFNHAVFGFQSSGGDVRETIESVEVDTASKPLADVIINSISVFVDERNGVLTLSAPEGTSGEADVMVTVSDGAGGVDSYTFHVTIEPDAGADSDAEPYLLPIDQIETTTNTPIEFAIPAVDVEGDQIYYHGSVDPAESNLVLDVLPLNGQATLTQTVPLAGVYSLRLSVGAQAGFLDDSQMVPVLIRPGAPAEIRLAATSDTGIDNADGITQLDNSADNLLEFIVSGTVAGAEVTLYADGQPIGQAVADGMSVTITTDGTYVLTDGTHSITAVQTLNDLAVDVGNRHDTVDLISDISAAFPITVDTGLPVFTSDPVATAVEGVAYTYDVETDAEAGGGVQYSLSVSPDGMTIDPGSGVVSWTPLPSQGPSEAVSIRATDAAGNFADQVFDVFTADTNQPPELAAIADQTVAEDEAVTLTAAATDPDVPDDTLTYSLDAGFPNGAEIDSATGEFTWTPGESQGPGTYSITVRVIDSGTPELFDTETFTVTVSETNQAPVLATIADQTISEGSTLSFTAGATDPDLPANTLTYSFDAGFPAGAQIDPASGQFTWTPGESQGPGTHTITVRVTDDGTPELFDTETFSVTISDANQAPVLEAIADQTVVEGVTLSLTASASDADVPADTLTYSLDTGFPSGAQIDSATGQLSWTPDESQGPGMYTIVVRVTDSGTPSLSDTESFIVTVDEANQAPVLAAIGDQTIAEGAAFAFTASATDPDVPANTLAYSLDVGFPAGAEIDSASGQFSWTPDELQGPGVYTIVVRVTDNGTPALFDTETFTVTVAEVNQAPVLAAIADQAVVEGNALLLTASATDLDLPADTLVYNLDVGFPSGAQIDSATGQFNWTPDEAQGPGMYTITVRVTDDGTPALTDTESFTVTVSEDNQAPVADANGPYVVAEGTPFRLDGTGSTDDWGIVSYEWDLDYDGSTFDVDATGQQPELTFFDNFAARTIALRVTDTDGIGDVQTSTLEVTNVDPAVEISGSVLPVLEGTEVTMSSLLVDPGSLDMHSYDWVVERNGVFYTAMSGAELTFTPEDNGTYKVSLTVTDDDGGIGTNAVFFGVINAAPVVTELNLSRPVIEIGEKLVVTGTFTDAGALDTHTVDIDWGDTITQATVDPVARTFTATHTYTTATDAIAVGATVTDNDGDSGGAGVPVAVADIVGPIGFSDDIEGLDTSAGDFWYSIEAAQEGWLTLEALSAGPVELTLYDAEADPLATSSLLWGNQRIDYEALAGETFYVKVNGTSTSVALRAINLVGQDGSAVTVSGTGDDDSYEFVSGAPHELTVNGVHYEFASATVGEVTLDGGGGNDTASLIGGDSDESAELWPDHGSFTSGGVVTTMTDVESIDIDGGGGNDTVVIHDSTGDDNLVARAATGAVPVSSITIADYSDDAGFVPSYSHSLDGFENLTTDSTAGVDIASFYDSDGDDMFVAKQFETVLSGPGFSLRAENYQYTHGYAKAGGHDTAEMYDTPQNDRFKADSTYARMFRGAYQRRAKFFETVVAYATGGFDDARLFDSMDTDQFIGTPTESRLYSDAAGYDIRVMAFDRVIARSSGGADAATFRGGAGDDLLLHKWLRADTRVKSPKTEMMDNDDPHNAGSAYSVTARRFSQTTAIGGQGGFDIARLWDTLDDDRFTAASDRAATYSSSNELLYDAIAFNKVVFNHVFGGSDTVEEDAHDFILSQYWAP